VALHNNGLLRCTPGWRNCSIHRAISADLKCRSIQDYAVLLTPQKNGSGPLTIPETFLRQA
jgi:hypothetical protein